MLQARPCLTWRDVQHIIVYTARRVDIEPSEWQVNSAGFSHSHKHGFGLLDSWALVTVSKVFIKIFSNNLSFFHQRVDLDLQLSEQFFYVFVIIKLE